MRQADAGDDGPSHEEPDGTKIHEQEARETGATGKSRKNTRSAAETQPMTIRLNERKASGDFFLQ